MKKLSVYVMIATLLFCSVAAAETNEAILFRGIEWGQIGDDALGAAAMSFENEEIKWIKLSSNGGKYIASDGKPVFVGAYKCSSASFKPDNTFVADYPISYVQLYFIPSVIDGKVHDSFEESVYVGANYLFSKKSINYISSAFSDVRAKLISLYGMPDIEYSIDDPDRGTAVCQWHGKDGTSVEMRTDAMKAADMESFAVYYGYYDIAERIDELNSLPLARTIGNTDGL